MGFLDTWSINRWNSKCIISQLLKPATTTCESNSYGPKLSCFFYAPKKIGRIAAGADANNYISIVPCQYDLTAHHAIPILNDEWDF